MNIHDATEVAYKNGYEAGVKKLAEKIKISATAKHKSIDGEYLYEISNDFIDNLVKEMVGNR